METFIESLNILDIDKRMGKLAGEFLHDYGKSHLVTMADALVGAAAKFRFIVRVAGKLRTGRGY